MPISKPIFLVGPMGSGKSFIGKKLAKHCELPFYDLDQLIEKGEQKSITQLFKSKGENEFRVLESQYLRNAPSTGVIATGGGTPCFHENMTWMNKRGYTIFLDTPIQLLTIRLQGQSAHRPLIAGMREDELASYLESMLRNREGWYKKAQYIYVQNSEGLPVERDIHSSFLKFIR